VTALRYEDLTPAEKAWMCNGCGPKLGVMPDLVPEFIFHEACQVHDFDYWFGKSARDRKQADQRFLDNMLDLADGQRSWWSRKWYSFLAWRYYAGVRSFGAKAFSFRDHYATHDDLVLEMRADP
jgi:hypothetical protein